MPSKALLLGRAALRVTASFLAGPDATFVTGAVIDSNGGYTA